MKSELLPRNNFKPEQKENSKTMTIYSIIHLRFIGIIRKWQLHSIKNLVASSPYATETEPSSCYLAIMCLGCCSWKSVIGNPHWIGLNNHRACNRLIFFRSRYDQHCWACTCEMQNWHIWPSNKNWKWNCKSEEIIEGKTKQVKFFFARTEAYQTIAERIPSQKLKPAPVWI